MRRAAMSVHGGLGRFLVGLIGCATFAVALAAPAGAYMRDFQVVRSSLGVADGPQRSHAFRCPPGKFAIGVGAGVSRGSTTHWTNLAINRMWIEVPPTGVVVVGAVESDPEPFDWAMTGQAYCAAFTFTQPNASTAGPYLKDVSLGFSQTPYNSTDLKATTASCPGGKRAIGGGFRLHVDGSPSFGPADVTLRSAQATASAFSVAAQEADAASGSWLLSAYAVCANVTAAFEDPNYVGNSITTPTATSQADSNPKSISVNCLGTGGAVIGGSAEVLGANSASARPVKVHLTRSAPSEPAAPGNPGGAPTTGHWEAAATEEDQISTPWRLRVRVVCASLAAPA